MGPAKGGCTGEVGMDLEECDQGVTKGADKFGWNASLLSLIGEKPRTQDLECNVMERDMLESAVKSGNEVDPVKLDSGVDKALWTRDGQHVLSRNHTLIRAVTVESDKDGHVVDEEIGSVSQNELEAKHGYDDAEYVNKGLENSHVFL
ncbi:hypothetical protein VNO78_08040 [Psophocarpus tetragonolobus]|uniref:Uncharacterized protein n=1 Tax=Psophocarpus tetragonolobus TaxID=3891 RepID=A0AAN9XTB9_PSOTE